MEAFMTPEQLEGTRTIRRVMLRAYWRIVLGYATAIMASGHRDFDKAHRAIEHIESTVYTLAGLLGKIKGTTCASESMREP